MPNGDDVGQRVEFPAEIRCRASHAGDATVEQVEHDGHADERRRRGELAAHRVDDAGIAAEHVGEREQARQQVHAPAETALLGVAAPQHVDHPAILPSALRPAGDHALGGTHGIARLDLEFAFRWDEHIHARAELHQSEPLAGDQLVADLHPAHHAAGQDADDLPENDRPVCARSPTTRCARSPRRRGRRRRPGTSPGCRRCASLRLRTGCG